MIAFVTGQVVEKGDGYCLIEVGGVGLRLNMSSQSIASLPAEGDDVRVWTHLLVRPEELTLFGFEDREERETFQKLISVSGVGPKVALAVLSGLSPATLSTAVATEDVALLSSIPGVGKKTAQRICLELRDKLAVSQIAGAPGRLSDAELDEARSALLGMGFTSAEAAVALSGFEGDASDARSLLTYALKRLGGGA